MKKIGVCKKILLALGCSLGVFVFCLFSTIGLVNKDKEHYISFYEFESQIYDVLKEDDQLGVEIDGDITFEGLVKTLNVEEDILTPKFDIKSESHARLTFEEIDHICEYLGYEVYENDEGYVAYSTFELKRLIVNGKVDNNYGAINVVSGYDDISILCYQTEADTEYAYNQLKLNTNLNVAIDMAFSVENIEEDVTANEKIHTSSSSHLSWGAEYIGVDAYIDYLGNISQEVVVVVIDSGINTSHEMFEDRFIYDNGNIVGYSYYRDNTALLSSNNKTYDDYMDDGSSGTSYFEDDNGHGTHVAGIICDLTPQNVKILPIRVTNNKGEGSTLAVEIALWRVKEIYADKYNIASINISMGLNKGSAVTESSILSLNQQVDPIVADLMDKNILTVVAAGNKKNSESSGKNYVYESGAWLAGCENTITVTALKQSGDSIEFDISYSHYGECVDMSAPGTAIESAYKGSSDSYKVLQGTSMASPHVAAVVALLCLDNTYWDGDVGSYTAAEVKNRLYNHAIKRSGEEIYYGNGIVSLVNLKRQIPFKVEDTICTYDGQYHGLNINVSEVDNYTIMYRTSNISNYYQSLDNSVFNDIFKNATTQPLEVLFAISTTDKEYYTTYGKAYLTINPRPIGIVIDSKQSNYGDNLLPLTATLNSGSLAMGETMDYLDITYSTTASARANVGSYNITGISNNTNYNATITNGVYTVTARPITITIGNSSGQYGDTVNLSRISATADLVNDDTIDELNLQFNTNISSMDTIGIYQDAISATYNNTNYKADIVNGDYTITPRNVNIILKDACSVYGEPLKELEYILRSGSQLANTDTLLDLNIVPVTLATSTSWVDKYVITATAGNENYNVSFTNGEYLVLPKDLIIDINNTSSYYAQPLNSLTYSLNEQDLVKDDTVADLNIELSTEATTNSNATDEGYIIIGQYNNPNYNITFKNGTYTILPLQVEIYIDDQTGVYGNEINLDNSLYQIVQPGNVDKSTLEIVLTTKATKISNVGDYDIEVKSNNPNCQIVAHKGTFTITKRNVVICLNSQEVKRFFEFKIDNNDYIIIDGEVCEGDNLDLLMSTDASWYSWMGEYNLSAISRNSNYNITILDAYVEVSTSITDIILLISILLVTIFIVIRIITLTIKNGKKFN